MNRICVSVLILAGFGLFARAQTQPDSLDSRGFKITRTTPDGKSATVVVPRGYALVIGVGEFKTIDHKYFLHYAQSDAQAMYRTLISPEGGAFPAENVHILIGKDATLANIKHELEVWLPSVAKEPDRVVVYYAGHGVVDDGVGYLVPYDANLANLPGTAYSMKQLGSVMANDIKARWKVLFADACHSGKITPQTSNDTIDASLGTLPKSFLTFSATRENEQSFEDPNLDGGFGLFTYYLVRGLSGYADLAPCDGIVTADELIEYVRSGVRGYARQRGAEETPNERGSFDDGMIMGLGKGCSSPAQSTRALTGTLVIEANMDQVQVYLDGQMQGVVEPGKPLSLPGIPAGTHTISGVHKGYDPDTKQVSVVPGEERSVTIDIRYPQTYAPAAENSVRKGEAILFSHRSSWNLAQIYAPQHQDLDRAREFFQDALKLEPHYALASYRLAQTDVLLSKGAEALQAFKQSLQDDATNASARVEYAGALIENGDTDEAVRQVLEVLRLRPKDDFALSLLARAFLDKGSWTDAVKYSDQAIALQQDNAEAHLWRGAALRELARQDKTNSLNLYGRACEDFQTFLRLTNFSTSLGSQIGFYFIGFGVGSRHHADREGAYRVQRVWAYTGLCHCEEKLGNLPFAQTQCQHALAIDKEDPTAHFYLGNVYRDEFNRTVDADKPECGPALDARSEYAATVRINPNLQEASLASTILSSIDKAVTVLHCQPGPPQNALR